MKRTIIGMVWLGWLIVTRRAARYYRQSDRAALIPDRRIERALAHAGSH